GIGHQFRRADCTYLLTVTVKPDQLRLAGALSQTGLRNQGLADHGKDGQVGLREILHGITDDARLARERVGVKIKALGDKSVVPPINEVTWVGVKSICARVRDRTLFIGVQ